MTGSYWSEGSRCDSGSLSGSVSVFWAVAPTTMPSSKPTPETAMAILGHDTLLQARLRMRLLISQSIGPVAGCRSPGPRVPGLRPGVAVPFAEPTRACVVTALALAAEPGWTGAWSRAATVAAGTTESSDSAGGNGPPLFASMPARLRRALGGTRGLPARLIWVF